MRKGLLPIWITGRTRTGKTTRLVAEFSQWVKRQQWLQQQIKRKNHRFPRLTPAILVFAANNDNRYRLADQLSKSVPGSYPVICKTPLGFMSDEVTLFWPLLFERLNLKAQFPLRLRPETEQELATRLWRTDLDAEEIKNSGMGEYTRVRRTLDLLQLAGASGTNPEDIPLMLAQALPAQSESEMLIWQKMGELLLEWRKWCLDRGLLTYGIIYELYWRYLLPDFRYQEHLIRRYRAIFADDVDDYPAIARDLWEFLLQREVFAVFTYNPDGKIRLGLNADPNYLAGLATHCQLEELTGKNELGELAVKLVTNPRYFSNLPASIQSIQTTSRAEMLRQTAEVIIQAVKNNQVKPEEIAIIAPGLDEIARYSLIEILSHHGIPITPLNEQRSLISSPIIRALLTILGLVYPGLGRLVARDDVAEMLVVLSRKPQGKEGKLLSDIDPVRAGLLADYCYYFDLDQPYLLPVKSFPRWDRLGYKTTNAYQEILAWFEGIKSLPQGDKFPSPLVVLERAIQRFCGNGPHLPFEQLSAVRELMETAQHYWEVERRLRQNEATAQTINQTVAEFIQLLRRGTITANPRPVSTLVKPKGAITLANVFQYRSLRNSHRWHFWLDTGSVFWEKGGAANLFAYSLFLKEWTGRALMPEEEYDLDQQRLERIIRDLFARVEEKLFLCHSDLGVNGSEQMGSLLILVHAALEVTLI